MGGEEFRGAGEGGSSLLDFIETDYVPVKNTFIQFDDESTPVTQRRLKTAPGRLPNFSKSPPGTETPADMEKAAPQTEEPEPLLLVEEDIPKGSASPSSFSPTASTRCPASSSFELVRGASESQPPVEEDSPQEAASPSSFRTVFDVEAAARKLASKDQHFSKTVRIYGYGIGGQGSEAAAASESTEVLKGPYTEFVVTLKAEAQSKRRGGSSFNASKGKGYIVVKCSDENLDVDLDISVVVGGNGLPAPGMQQSRKRHNFSENSVTTLPGLRDVNTDVNAPFDFQKEVDVNTGKLTLGFEAVPCHSLQLSSPA